MGRRKIYNTDEERKEAKRLQTKQSYQKMKGGNLTQSFNSFVHNLENKVKKTSKSIGKYVDVVLNGRNDYPPKVRDILSKYGNQILSSATIVRAPVPSVLTSALNAVSLGAFGNNLQNSPYDKLFHLRLDFTTNAGTKLMVEKNEVINMEVNPSSPKDEERKSVPSIPVNLSVNQMMENTKKMMGSKFFAYSARDNNCQDFIIALLNSNNMGNQEDRTFVKQNTKELFNNLTTLRKISNTVTNLGAKVNEITMGAGINYDKMNWGSLTRQFNHYRRKHPNIKSLEEYSKYILDHPKEFHKKTHHRASFYIDVIKKKKGINIIHHHHYHYH